MVKSPCKRICKFDPHTTSEDDICIGCYRTKHEFRMWKRSSDEWKQNVLERISKWEPRKQDIQVMKEQ